MTMKRKIYVGIGFFKDRANKKSEKVLEIVVFAKDTKANFMRDCVGNGFAAQVVLTEEILKRLYGENLDCMNMDSLEVYEQVKKLTTNYRVWNRIESFLTDGADCIIDAIKQYKTDFADLLQ